MLQEVEETLQEFYAHVYGPDGSGGGAADMLLSEAKTLAAQLQVGCACLSKTLKPAGG